MPTLSSTLTSFTTLYVTLTADMPQNEPELAITSAIRGLSDCTQDVLFPLLSNRQCNPADFPCICAELDRLQARAAVAAACPADVQQYNDFVLNTCGNIVQIVTISDTSVPAVTIIPVIVTTAAPDNFTSSAGSFNNGTAAPVAPTSTESPIVVGRTSQPESQPESTSRAKPHHPKTKPTKLESTASPAGSQSPSIPEFSGAAVGDFGKASMAGFAGGMGIMWLAFAQL
ncbi:hypothetical protein BU23DRAFT_595616 [Bimuria novae-zelandiae CBS 107.79]|uniref:Uncharacterized protein n=1 Tax=Bimuria novae-zelandiae CBS 107.79 TaxID=1447943 RepID=A0A6A5VL46_9PLEO|nr:hypothetical protein BU23DRAFT_595616 [Bimuria novae-zelandiae CBS 107.79]